MLKRASTRGWAPPGAVEEGFSRGCQLELCIARNTTTWAIRRAKIRNLGRFTGNSSVKNALSPQFECFELISFNLLMGNLTYFTHDFIGNIFIELLGSMNFLLIDKMCLILVQRIFKDFRRKRYRRSCRIYKILRVTVSRNRSPDQRLIILITGQVISHLSVIYPRMRTTRCNNCSTGDPT